MACLPLERCIPAKIMPLAHRLAALLHCGNRHVDYFDATGPHLFVLALPKWADARWLVICFACAAVLLGDT